MLKPGQTETLEELCAKKGMRMTDQRRVVQPTSAHPCQIGQVPTDRDIVDQAIPLHRLSGEYRPRQMGDAPVPQIP